jgi:nitrite reductase/ring-hydroxylating ferredoxin subunit
MPDIRYISDADSVLSRCVAGEVLVLREFLQNSELYHLVMDAIFSGIREYAGSAAAEELKRSGLGSVHHYVSPEQIQQVIPHVEKNLLPFPVSSIFVQSAVDWAAGKRFGCCGIRYSKVDPCRPYSFHALNPLYLSIRRRIRNLVKGSSSDQAERREVRAGSVKLQGQSVTSGSVEGNSLPLEVLTPGVPLPITPTHCLVRLATNEVYRLNRQCPHESADLALGYVVGTSLHCPWHNLPFDIVSGCSPCVSLPELGSLRCVVEQGTVLLPVAKEN